MWEVIAHGYGVCKDTTIKAQFLNRGTALNYLGDCLEDREKNRDKRKRNSSESGFEYGLRNTQEKHEE